MSNAVTIILIVGVAAVGIAYLANMFCQPSGGVLCYPASAPAGVPVAPALDLESGKGLIPAYVKGIEGVFGGVKTPPKGVLASDPVVTGTTPAVTNFRALFEQGRIASAHPKGGGAKSQAERECQSFKSKPGLYQQCLKARAASFAEAESYYVRTA